MLVTIVTVAAAALAVRGTPSTSIAIRLVLVMLPAQLAIGAANDLFDVAADRITKPHKPLVRQAVSPRVATVVIVAGVLMSLTSAATLGVTPLLIAVAGLSAGLGYDAGLKRSPWSWITWWVGVTAIPLGAYAAVQRIDAALWWVVPLAGLLSLGLHCANALPDLDGDRAAGVVSLPVWLGAQRSRLLLVLSPIAAATFVLALRSSLGQQGAALPVAVCALGVVGIACALLTRRTNAAGQRLCFPLLAIVSAVAAIAWLATLPA